MAVTDSVSRALDSALAPTLVQRRLASPPAAAASPPTPPAAAALPPSRLFFSALRFLKRSRHWWCQRCGLMPHSIKLPSLSAVRSTG